MTILSACTGVNPNSITLMVVLLSSHFPVRSATTGLTQSIVLQATAHPGFTLAAPRLARRPGAGAMT